MNAYIKQIASYFPETTLSNADVTQKVVSEGYPLRENMMDTLIGECERHYASKEEQVSDLAVKAAKKIVNGSPESYDLLIFASACADLIEPATSNIVQHKLGLSCPTFDVKNACNSVATAIDIANSMIIAGTARKVLIVSGEKPSDSIKIKGLNKENIVQHFAALSFGDAGVAIEIEGTEEEKGILYSKSKTFGKYWNLCNVLGGGSMYPQDASKLVFSGDTYKLKTVMDKVAPDFIHSCMAESGYALEDVDLICSHQVSKRTASTIHQHLNIGLDRIMQTFQKFGNTASTSMPIALEQALAQGKAKKGDLIMLLGLAAGINVSVQLVRA